MEVTFDILDSDADLQKKIISVFAAKLNSVLVDATKSIEIAVREQIMRPRITLSPEWISLQSGQLRADLGIANPDPVLNQLLNDILDGIRVSVKKVHSGPSGLQGGLEIHFLPVGHGELLNKPYAKFLTRKGYEIRWLDWLLTRGDAILVADYIVKTNLTTGQKSRSRTRVAVMVRGSGYRIPAYFSGTLSDNFLIRSFDDAKLRDELEDVIQHAIYVRI